MKNKFLLSKLRNTFFYNTLLILISGFIVKILGLTNKIFITRLLGTDGMALYVLAFPTIILFISLSGFSLNVTTSKLIAESLKTKTYSPKKILKAALSIALKTAIVVEIIFLLSISFLVNKLLKNPELFYPLLMTCFLIPLVGVTDTLRGLFSGYQKMTNVALVNIIEQISRILFSILSIIIFSKYGIVLSVSLTIFALTIGEFASFIYLLLRIKKLEITDFKTENNEKKAVWKMAFPTTLSRLIGSFTYFLEPIINTLILLELGYDKKLIDLNYTIINAYIIPLLTISVFLSNSLATTAVPAISEINSQNNKKGTNYIIDKIFFFALVPGLIISVLLYLYPNQYLNLFFSTNEGAHYIKNYVFLFLIHYLQSPGIAIMQALGKAKSVFKICTFFNFLRLVLIVVFALIPLIATFSIFYAITISMIFETLVIWIYIVKLNNYKPSISKLINLFLILIFILSIGTLLTSFVNNYLVSSIILLLLYLLLIKKFKLLNIESLFT